jgi:hypothetical protein
MCDLPSKSCWSHSYAERRLSEAVRESCLVDGRFCGEDMSPPQLREGGMTSIIAAGRACIRRDAPAEGRARGRPGRGRSGSRPQAVTPGAGRYRAAGQALLVPARWHATAPPGRPHSPCPSWGPDDPGPDGHLKRSARPARARAIRCPAAPGADGELINELGMPSAEPAGQAREWTRQGTAAAVTAATAKTPL